VSVVVVMLVRCVDADSVDVLIVELHEEFMTMTFGTADDELLAGAVVSLAVFAVLK